jgi:hypothetical protein
MWERIKAELEEVDVESLGFDHPICSRVLDVKSEPCLCHFATFLRNLSRSIS